MSEVKRPQLTNEEKRFLNNAVLETKNELGEIDVNTKDGALLVINKYRAMGKLTPRRRDNGRESDIWRGLREKLGSPVKSQDEIRKEQEEARIKAAFSRDMIFYEDQEKKLLNRLANIRQSKTELGVKMEETLIAELALLEEKKKAKQMKLQMIKNATPKTLDPIQEARLNLDKDILEERMNGDDKERKCWNCGQWFKVAGGAFTKHVTNCK